MAAKVAAAEAAQIRAKDLESAVATLRGQLAAAREELATLQVRWAGRAPLNCAAWCQTGTEGPAPGCARQRAPRAAVRCFANAAGHPPPMLQRQQAAAQREAEEARQQAAKAQRELASTSDYLAGVMSELAVRWLLLLGALPGVDALAAPFATPPRCLQALSACC